MTYTLVFCLELLHTGIGKWKRIQGKYFVVEEKKFIFSLVPLRIIP